MTRRRLTRRATVAVATLAVLAVALPAWAFWTWTSTHSTSFTAGTLPGSSVTVPQYSSGTVAVSWTAVTAPGGGAVDGYYVERLSGVTPTAACSTTPASLTTALTCNDTAGAGTYTYQVTAVFRSWTTPAASSAVLVDVTAPTSFTAALSNATGGSTFINGSTVYTNPQAGKAGGFTVTAGPTDAESGIKKVTFPALTGFASGGGDDTVAPYTTTYAWSGSGATATGAQSVVAQNNALSTTSASFTVTPDTALPTGGAVSASNSGTGTVPVTVTQFTDGLSGIATSALTRAAGTLSAGSCGAVSGTSLVTVSGGNDTQTLTTGCYQYSLAATDNVGNVATPAQSSVVKVDTTPATFTFSASGTGTTVGSDGTSVYFRTGTGSFTLTVADAESGISSVTFPTITGWTVTGSGNSRTYSNPTSSAVDATASVSVTNGAGTTTTPSVSLVRQTATPAAFDVQASNGGTANRADSGDVMTLTFNTVVNPATILSGWDGTATSVKVKFNEVSATNDSAIVQNSSAVATNLGTISLGGDYVQNNGHEYTLNATMTMATVSGKSVVTVTFTSSDANAQSATGTKTMSWGTTTSVKDWGNQAAVATAASESGSADADF
jgi:hypothetical protein